jgi:hypothetical protein
MEMNFIVGTLTYIESGVNQYKTTFSFLIVKYLSIH